MNPPPASATEPSDQTAPAPAPASPAGPPSTTSPAPVARLTNVTLRYKKVTALAGVTLQLPAGCMVGLIGPDGVGKSSLLALLAGARAVQQGQVEVLGGDIAQRRHRQAVCPHIAFMPQGLGKNLYPTLSVEENLQFFARLFGHDAPERRRRIDALTHATGLQPFLARPAGKLSGGMKQKLGLCCALIHDPDLLILDEPTTGVDPLARAQFWALIAQMRRQRPGMSVLVATAYMEEAQRFDWLVAMDAGQVLASGSPAELLARTGHDTLEAAFIALLPPDKRRGHQPVRLTPLQLDAQAEVAIETRDLSMRFGDFVAVDQVNFCIRRGEIFGFVGSNGCGKSTTMKMLTGLLSASAGQAWLFGQPVDPHDLATRQRVGYMSQAFSLYGELTVQQNLLLHARLFHVPAAELAARVAESLARFGLQQVQDALPEQLPLGMRQRLSLAVATVHRPELLILDEPTSGVDPIARDTFWQLMIDLARRDHVTLFISTHFMNEAQRCDRIALMHAGHVLVSAAPADIVARRGAASLEEAFISHLKEATAEAAPAPIDAPPPAASPSQTPGDAPSDVYGSAATRRAIKKLFHVNDPGQEPPQSRQPDLPSVGAQPSGRWTSAAPTAIAQRAGLLQGKPTPIVFQVNGLAARLRRSLTRLHSYQWREALELRRDPVRGALALLGSLLLMFVMGYGISMDVGNLRFAVLDHDQTLLSRNYTLNLAGSGYFSERPALHSDTELDQRMRSGELSLVLEIPPGFARDVARGQPVQMGAWVDGAMPQRAETVIGFTQGMHQQWLMDQALAHTGRTPSALLNVETRYRYNPDVRSLPAMVPAVIPLLLLMLPAMLTALAVVREKELGSIINLYVTPVTRSEFLLGKQLPYVLLAMLNYALMCLAAVTVFGVPMSGSFATLTLAALIFAVCSTGMGLLASTVTRSQIAAMFFAMVGTMIPAVQFAGLINPVSSLEGSSRWMGELYPASHMFTISRGVFSKALGFADLQAQFWPMLAAIPVILGLAIVLLKKQEA